MAGPWEQYNNAAAPEVDDTTDQMPEPTPAPTPMPTEGPWTAYQPGKPWEQYQKVAAEPTTGPWTAYQPPGTAEDREIQDRSFFDRPGIGDQPVTDAEISDIAKKFNVDPEILRKQLPFFGGQPENQNISDLPEAFAGAIGSSIGLGLPQKLVKRVLPKKYEDAFDELESLASGRASYASLAGQALTPGGVVGAGRLASAAIGSAAGAFNAPAGKELEGAVTGFGIGLGGHIVADIGGKILGRIFSREAPEVEKTVAKQFIDKNSAGIDEGTQKILDDRAESEDAIKDLIMGHKEMSPEVATQIVSEQVDPDTLQLFNNPSTEEGQLLRNQIPAEDILNLGTERAIDTNLANQIVETRARDFAEELTKERPADLNEARNAIQDYADREGEQATRDRYNIFTQEQAAMQYIDQNAIRLGRGNKATDKVLNWISDAQFVLRDIDERSGLPFELEHQMLNKNYNRMSFARNAAREDLNTIYQRNKAIDRDLTTGGEVYKALDTGDTSSLTPRQTQAYQDFRNNFDKQRDYVNGVVAEKDPQISPLSIPKEENYVPHILLSPEDLTTQFEQRHELALKDVSYHLDRPITDLSQMTPREFMTIKGQSFPLRNFMAGLQTLDNKEIVTGAAASAKFKDLTSGRQGQQRLTTLAKAAQDRTGNIPDWMREKNLYTLADKWSNNTLKHLYLRKNVDKLASMARQLDRAGADTDASYVRNLLQAVNGVRVGTPAEATLRGVGVYMSAVDKLTDGKGPVIQAAGSVAKAVPYIVGDMTKLVHANLLGLNPHSLLLNAMHSLTVTAPELGSAYGYATVLRGIGKTVMDLPGQMKKVTDLGFKPDEFVGAYSRYVSEGIRRTSLYSMSQSAVDWMGKAAMYLYTRMDHVNRAVTLSTAEMVAYDLARGSEAALTALKKQPSSLQRAINNASNTEEVANLIATHLNATSNKNYNKISMSQYGRDMGPLFSTFSKWPTAVVGSAIQEARNKGLISGGSRTLEKLAVPFIMLQLADIAIFGADPEKPWQENDDKKSDIMKKLLGSEGLSSAAPIGTLKSITEGRLFTPPVVDLVINGLLRPALEGNSDKLAKTLSQALQDFGPGSVIVRFITDDLLTYMSGTRPEGTDFIERTQEGIRRLKK